MKYLVDKTYRWRGMKVRIPAVLVSGYLFYRAFQSVENGQPFFGIWTVSFVSLVLAGLVFEVILRRTYRCPECSKNLEAPRIEVVNNQDEYVYDCKICEITWRTMTLPGGD